MTGKPGCFVYNDKLKREHLTTLMNKAIERYTVARSRQDIIEFVKSVAENNHVESRGMSRWVKDNIALNYPRVSEYILNEINILNKVGQ